MAGLQICQPYGLRLGISIGRELITKFVRYCIKQNISEMLILRMNHIQKRTTIGIGLVLVLCSVSFWLGKLSGSHDVITYSVDGWATSFNRAWPTYGLPLAEDKALLVLLRDGKATNAIPHLEAMLDMATYDAICRRPLLRGREIDGLDKALVGVAHYREQFPRAIDTSTNGFGNPAQLQQYEKWIAEQREIDAFLHDFAKH
jgi:hypothetical protein